MGLFALDTRGTVESAIEAAQRDIELYDYEEGMEYLLRLAIANLERALKRIENGNIKTTRKE